MKDNFRNNIGTWVLISLLVFSVYSHYRTGEKLEKVCIDVLTLEQGYFDLESNESYTPSGIDMDAIILKVKESQRLLESNSSEGRAYKWYRIHIDELKDICSEQLTEVDDYE